MLHDIRHFCRAKDLFGVSRFGHWNYWNEKFNRFFLITFNNFLQIHRILEYSKMSSERENLIGAIGFVMQRIGLDDLTVTLRQNEILSVEKWDEIRVFFCVLNIYCVKKRLNSMNNNFEQIAPYSNALYYCFLLFT